MTAIVLHGAAALQFGGPFHLHVRSPAEAMRALIRLKPGFREFVAAAEWRIIKGKTKSAVREERDCSVEELDIGFGRESELHVIPVMSGAGKGKGIGKIVVGVAIIALSIVTAGGALGAFGALGAAMAAGAASIGVSAGSIAMLGATILLGGISQMLAGNPKQSKVDSREDSTQRVNSLFNGPVNVGSLGQTIPLVYGPDVIVGTVVGSAGLMTEQVVL